MRNRKYDNMSKKNNTLSTLNYIVSGLSMQNYDMADKYGHLLISNFCGLKHNQKAYSQARKIKKTIQSLDNAGIQLKLTAYNTKTTRQIHMQIIKLRSLI